MSSHIIDKIVESLVNGGMGINDFMQAVEKRIEATETGLARPSGQPLKV